MSEQSGSGEHPHRQHQEEHGQVRLKVQSANLGWLALGGLLLGALIGAWMGWMVAGGGPWPIAGLGQIAASGPPAAVVALGGIGAAVFGLAGALIGLFRIPAPDGDRMDRRS